MACRSTDQHVTTDDKQSSSGDRISELALRGIVERNLAALYYNCEVTAQLMEVSNDNAASAHDLPGRQQKDDSNSDNDPKMQHNQLDEQPRNCESDAATTMNGRASCGRVPTNLGLRMSANRSGTATPWGEDSQSESARLRSLLDPQCSHVRRICNLRRHADELKHARTIEECTPSQPRIPPDSWDRPWRQGQKPKMESALLTTKAALPRPAGEAPSVEALAQCPIPFAATQPSKVHQKVCATARRRPLSAPGFSSSRVCRPAALEHTLQIESARGHCPSSQEDAPLKLGTCPVSVDTIIPKKRSVRPPPLPTLLCRLRKTAPRHSSRKGTPRSTFGEDVVTDTVPNKSPSHQLHDAVDVRGSRAFPSPTGGLADEIRESFYGSKLRAKKDAGIMSNALAQWDVHRLARELSMPIDDIILIKTVFDSFDDNGDGSLDVDEFEKAVLRLLQLQLRDGSGTVQRMKSISAWSWWEGDADHSEGVNFPEFLKWYSSNGFNEELLLSDRERWLRSVAKAHGLDANYVDTIKRCFDSFDADRSGTMTIDEFHMLLRKLLKVPPHVDLPESRVRHFWSQVVDESTGKAFFEDFVKWWLKTFGNNDCGSSRQLPFEDFYRQVRRVGKRYLDPPVNH